jgi:aminoglycoside phosphotransferase (APT) family kinase protein
VELNGWDNSTFHLGADMSVRMPTRDQDALAVAKEHRFVPILGPHLPLSIPRPLRRGVPELGFGRAWSVYSWLPGMPAESDPVADKERFARGSWLSS